jgi:hypothetical protein
MSMSFFGDVARVAHRRYRLPGSRPIATRRWSLARRYSVRFARPSAEVRSMYRLTQAFLVSSVRERPGLPLLDDWPAGVVPVPPPLAPAWLA